MQKLVDGATATLIEFGVAAEDITLVWVPGSYEIPLATLTLLDATAVDAVIALGIVIEGETTHAEEINHTVSVSLDAISLETGVPIAHGVLGVRNRAQAEARCGGDKGNRGAQVAAAAITMVRAMQALRDSTDS